MKELIAALESATGPSRELDLRIWCETGQEGSGESVAFYTSSIDAAITLYQKEPYSNIAGFLYSAMYQTRIGDIPDELLACRISAHALKAQLAASSSQ